MSIFGTRLARGARIAGVIFTVLFIATGTVLAGDHKYGDGPLTDGDYKQTPPNPLPTDGGIPLTANTQTGTGFRNDGISTPTGGQFTYTPTSVDVYAYVDPDQSWNADPTNKDLLNHEQSHFDLEEQMAREAQAEINKQIASGKLKGKGATPEEAEKDLQDKVDKIIDKIKDSRQEKLDQKTKHGTDAAEQKKAEDAIRKALLKPNTNNKSKKLSQAQTAAPTLSFDSGTGKLAITGDTITGITNADGTTKSGSDPSLGASISFPDFFYAGTNANGFVYFAAAEGADQITIGSAAAPDFEATLTYLLYDPTKNLLFGLATGYEFNTMPVAGSYLDDLRIALGSGAPALFGVNITPDINLFSATAGFTTRASTTMTNSDGARLLPVPLPAPLTMGVALLSTVGLMTFMRRRRQLHQSQA